MFFPFFTLNYFVCNVQERIVILTNVGLKYYLNEEFSFKNSYIGKHGQKMYGGIVVENYFSDYSRFTTQDLFAFVEENKLPLTYDKYLSVLYKKFIRIDKNLFVTKENVKINNSSEYDLYGDV